RLPHRPHEGGAARGHVPAGTAWDRGKWGTGGAVPDVGRPRLSWVGRRSQPGPGLVVPRGRGRGGSRRRTVLCWLSSFGRGGGGTGFLGGRGRCGGLGRQTRRGRRARGGGLGFGRTAAKT